MTNTPTCTLLTLAMLSLGVGLTLGVHDRVARSSEWRVIGGKMTKVGDWPWLVKLRARFPSHHYLGIPTSNVQYHCTATLINKWWVLTAAHCIPIEHVGRWKAMQGRYYHLRMGYDVSTRSSLFDKMLEYWGRILKKKDWRNWEVQASKIIMHPHYRKNKQYENNIALIKLRKPVPTGKEIPEVNDVKLPAQDDMAFPADNQECVMKGWGCTKKKKGGRATISILAKVSDEMCRERYRSRSATALCAGRKHSHNGICPGDSGGPLVCKDSNDDWVLVGIASLTSSYALGHGPAVFTQTSTFVSWIRDTMKRN